MPKTPELVEALNGAINALKVLVSLLESDKSKVDEEKAVEVKQEVQADEAKKLTFEEFRAKLAEVIHAGFRDQVKEVISKYAEKASLVDPKDYDAILKEVEVAQNAK